jgi:hypothetical protein
VYLKEEEVLEHLVHELNFEKQRLGNEKQRLEMKQSFFEIIR